MRHQWMRHEYWGCCHSNGYSFFHLVIEKKKEFNLKRNLDLFFISFCYGAPILHFWYCKILPKIRLTFFPNVSKAANVFMSMLLDELAFGPILYSAFYPTYQIIADRDIRSFGKGV